MNRLIRKLTLAFLLSLVLLGATSPTLAWGQTGPLPSGSTKVNRPAEANKVHLIVTGYTAPNGKDIGPDCRADLIAVQSMFSQAFVGEWRNRLVVHPLYGEAWTAAKVRTFLQEMNVGSNDVVVFYHAGHGGIQNAEQPVKTHMLQVSSHGFLSRDEVRNLLLARHCRGVIVLSDCCSSLPKVAQGRSLGGTQPQGPARLNQATIRNLFLRFQGLVDITAAAVGQVAINGNQLNDFGGARGAFTAAFLRLASETRVFSGWGDFYPALQEMTRTSSGQGQQPHAFTIREEATGTAVTDPQAPLVTGPLPR